MRITRHRTKSGPPPSNVKFVCKSCGRVRWYYLNQIARSPDDYVCRSCTTKKIHSPEGNTVLPSIDEDAQHQKSEPKE